MANSVPGSAVARSSFVDPVYQELFQQMCFACAYLPVHQHRAGGRRLSFFGCSGITGPYVLAGDLDGRMAGFSVAVHVHRRAGSNAGQKSVSPMYKDTRTMYVRMTSQDPCFGVDFAKDRIYRAVTGVESMKPVPSRRRDGRHGCRDGTIQSSQDLVV
ncbi:hypothetical protein BM221_004042 [Beauveria bassiana]|uniref:Uncharacterized protein n=1 Tax=Beauveria bassiana TaxID=176275 RepID=A0A2N6NQ47_BEABA|nr:hypothetical protein BM221_004042 [Beauveria bassiana]